jgi:hypothetical protein
MHRTAAARELPPGPDSPGHTAAARRRSYTSDRGRPCSSAVRHSACLHRSLRSSRLSILPFGLRGNSLNRNAVGPGAAACRGAALAQSSSALHIQPCVASAPPAPAAFRPSARWAAPITATSSTLVAPPARPRCPADRCSGRRTGSCPSCDRRCTESPARRGSRYRRSAATCPPASIDVARLERWHRRAPVAGHGDAPAGHDLAGIARRRRARSLSSTIRISVPISGLPTEDQRPCASSGSRVVMMPSVRP